MTSIYVKVVRLSPKFAKLCKLTYIIDIDYVTQVTHLLFFNCEIGDFKIAGRVCLQKKFVCLLSYKVFLVSFLKLCIENELDGTAHIK
jgi:hypothetical protein